jgi:hypothetical protein
LKNTSKITDAYVVIQIYSEEISVAQMIAAAGFTPTETADKGTRANARSIPRPANFIRLSTEHLVDVKDLNAHIAFLRSSLPAGKITDRLDMTKVEAICSMYWWTKEEVNFNLTMKTLEALSSFGVSVDFNYLVDAGNDKFNK